MHLSRHHLNAAEVFWSRHSHGCQLIDSLDSIPCNPSSLHLQTGHNLKNYFNTLHKYAALQGNHDRSWSLLCPELTQALYYPNLRADRTQVTPIWGPKESSLSFILLCQHAKLCSFELNLSPFQCSSRTSKLRVKQSTNVDKFS